MLRKSWVLLLILVLLLAACGKPVGPARTLDDAWW